MESLIAQGVCIKCKHAFTHAATMRICDHHASAPPREICQRICDHFASICYRWCKASHRNGCLSDFFWSYPAPSLTREFTERIYKHSASPIIKSIVFPFSNLRYFSYISHQRSSAMSHKQRLSNGSKPLETLAPDCHAQNNSAVQKLEALLSLAGSFAADQEAKKVIDVFKETSDLLDGTHHKDSEIAAQRAKMEAMEKKHKDFREQQTEVFEMAQMKLRAKLGDLEAKILDLTRDIAQKNSIVDKLKDSSAKSEYETEQLQKLSASQKARADADAAKIDKLENLYKKARDENTSLCEQLQKEKEQQTRSKSAHGTLQQNFDTLRRDHNSIEQRWQLAQSLRVELSDEEPEALYVTLPIRWWAL